MFEVAPRNLEWNNSCDSLSIARTNLAKGPQFFLYLFVVCILLYKLFLTKIRTKTKTLVQVKKWQMKIDGHHLCENHEFENQLKKKLKY